MQTTQTKQAVVLLAEDSPADQRLVQRAFTRGQIPVDVKTVADGEEAMNYLRREGNYGDPSKCPRPDLLLLDINMPRMNGKQVLRAIRKIESLHSLPVVMLTTSNHENDVLETYDLGVNAYITKPPEINDFFEAMRKLEDFWFGLVKLPSAVH